MVLFCTVLHCMRTVELELANRKEYVERIYSNDNCSLAV
jgi:hypothetical protein